MIAKRPRRFPPQETDELDIFIDEEEVDKIVGDDYGTIEDNDLYEHGSLFDPISECE